VAKQNILIHLIMQNVIIFEKVKVTYFKHAHSMFNTMSFHKCVLYVYRNVMSSDRFR